MERNNAAHALLVQAARGARKRLEGIQADIDRLDKELQLLLENRASVQKTVEELEEHLTKNGMSIELPN